MFSSQSRSEIQAWLIHGFVVILAVVAVGCVAKPSYEVREGVKHGAAVSGHIRLGGPVPNPETAMVYRDSDLCGPETTGEELIVSEDTKGIYGMVVSLEGVKEGKPLPQQSEQVLENRGCRFLPSVMVGASGLEIGVQNLDPVMHYTHARRQTRYGDTLWNVIQLEGAEGVRKEMTTPGIIDVRCDLHPSMKSYIHIFSHPYFTNTNVDGYFELLNVPAGNYTLRAWHPRIGIREKPIIVPSEGKIAFDLTIEAK
jgi:hypothetical protein